MSKDTQTLDNVLDNQGVFDALYRQINELKEQAIKDAEIIWKLQMIDDVLREALQRYAVHETKVNNGKLEYICPATYLRGDPNCMCGLCDLMEELNL